MKKALCLAFSGILSMSLLAQADKSQFLYTQDGKLIGNKKELVRDCASEMTEEGISEPDKLKICDCILYQMASHLTYKDFTKMVKDDDFDFETVMKDKKHKDMADGVVQCVFSMMQSDGGTTAFKEQFMAECIKGFEKEAGEMAVAVDARVYCNCMLEKISENTELTENFMKQVNDEESPLIAEAALPCVMLAMEQEGADTAATEQDSVIVTEIDPITLELLERKEPVKYKGSEDVEGDIISVEVPLIRYLSTYALKVKIGGLEKRFILDSGASDVLIDKEFERELLAAKIITKDDVVGDKLYALADGRKVKAKVYVLNGLQVGGFTVDNVMAGVLAEDASLLLGKSFLDKFSKWNIDNEKKTLYLEK